MVGGCTAYRQIQASYSLSLSLSLLSLSLRTLHTWATRELCVPEGREIRTGNRPGTPVLLDSATIITNSAAPPSNSSPVLRSLSMAKRRQAQSW